MPIPFKSAIDMGGQQIQNGADGSAATDFVTLQQLQAMVRGLDWKPSVRAASTANINLASPGASIDGVSMASGESFLAKNQTAPAENGLYTWNGAASAATRRTDADVSAEVTSGMAVTVTEGTANGDTVWVLSTNDPITLGTTGLTFAQLGGGSTPYTAGNGLTLSGQEFNVGAGTGITVASDTVAIDTAVVTRKVAGNIGDGSSTSIAFTHSLGTRDVQVQVARATTPWETVWCEVERTDTNTVTLKFSTAPTSNQYRVMVQG